MPKLHGLPRYELVRLQNGMKLVAITAYLGQFAIYLENFVDIHDYENVVLIILLAIVGLTLVCCTAFGVLLGARIFRRTEIVYVMR